jgi:hypothetical protein
MILSKNAEEPGVLLKHRELLPARIFVENLPDPLFFKP